MLIKSDIQELVENGAKKGVRDTTHDSCVGEIITKNGCHEGSTYKLRPRHIVWLVSQETYKLDKNTTGITTLRTTWTNKGILTLTVGVVDPGWNGPLSTAVINFSGTDFYIQKGKPFFRTVFFKHEDTNADTITVEREDYISQVLAQASLFSDTFLTLDTLVPEVTKEIFKLPRIAAWAGWAALVLSVVGLLSAYTAPALNNTFDVVSEIKSKNAKIEILESRLSTLEKNLEALEPEGDELNAAPLGEVDLSQSQEAKEEG